MLTFPALIEPALELRRALDGGVLFTPLAERMCGQQITADVERAGPLILDREEAGLLGLEESENWACLRRGGKLVQADGTEVARITSVVSLARVSPEVVTALQATATPLGKALDGAHSKVLWCTVGITEYAVACGRTIVTGDRSAALTTDWVLWSWLAAVTADSEGPCPLADGTAP